MDKVACDTLEMLDEQIRKINKKGDISPAELDSLHKAYEVRCLITNASDEAYEEGMSGRRYMPRMSYGRTAWHMPPNMYGESYGYDHDDSYARGRSPVTGRYISRDGAYRDDTMSRRGYETGNSGHSIKDRMIARLEAMYDEAKSEHERQVISEEIRRLETRSE